MSQSSYRSSQIQSVQINQQVSSCPKSWHDTCYPIIIDNQIQYNNVKWENKVHISIAREKN